MNRSTFIISNTFRIFLFFLLLTPISSLYSQRIKLLQLERYLGDTIGPGRKNYVGLTNTNGDQEYKKLDSIIVHLSDSLIGLIPPDVDTDQQYFDTAVIINDTLILSIVRDGVPAKRFDLKKYTVNTKGEYTIFQKI